MKAIFLDRDGVINKYPGDKKYVTSLKEFRFLPLVKKAIARLWKHGFNIFVITLPIHQLIEFNLNGKWKKQ